MVVSDYFRGNIVLAYSDLLLRIGQYRREISERIDAIHHARARGERALSVAPFSDPPRSVFIVDITDSAESYYNRIFAEHYGLARIMLR